MTEKIRTFTHNNKYNNMEYITIFTKIKKYTIDILPRIFNYILLGKLILWEIEYEKIKTKKVNTKHYFNDDTYHE